MPAQGPAERQGSRPIIPSSSADLARHILAEARDEHSTKAREPHSAQRHLRPAARCAQDLSSSARPRPTSPCRSAKSRSILPPMSRRSASMTPPAPIRKPTPQIDLAAGLPLVREPWLAKRAGFETYAGRAIRPEDNGHVVRRQAGAALPRGAGAAARPRRRARHPI